MAIDPALIGYWIIGGTKYLIGNDDWYYVVSTNDFYIPPDGTSLEIGDTYARIYGNGQSIIGVWRLSKSDNGVMWIEERAYSSDGIYSGHWTADGQFDSNYVGNFSVDGLTVTHEERRARLETNGNTILFDRPFDVDFSGTYEINSSGQLVIIIDGVTYVYTPVK